MLLHGRRGCHGWAVRGCSGVRCVGCKALRCRSSQVRRLCSAAAAAADLDGVHCARDPAAAAATVGGAASGRHVSPSLRRQGSRGRDVGLVAAALKL